MSYDCEFCKLEIDNLDDHDEECEIAVHIDEATFLTDEGINQLGVIHED